MRRSPWSPWPASTTSTSGRHHPLDDGLAGHLVDDDGVGWASGSRGAHGEEARVTGATPTEDDPCGDAGLDGVVGRVGLHRARSVAMWSAVDGGRRRLGHERRRRRPRGAAAGVAPARNNRSADVARQRVTVSAAVGRGRRPRSDSSGSVPGHPRHPPARPRRGQGGLGLTGERARSTVVHRAGVGVSSAATTAAVSRRPARTSTARPLPRCRAASGGGPATPRWPRRSGRPAQPAARCDDGVQAPLGHLSQPGVDVAPQVGDLEAEAEGVEVSPTRGPGAGRSSPQGARRG